MLESIGDERLAELDRRAKAGDLSRDETRELLTATAAALVRADVAEQMYAAAGREVERLRRGLAAEKRFAGHDRAELERLRAHLAELEAVHARCADLYVGGRGPAGVIEVSAPLCACGCESGQPCGCGWIDCDCRDDCPVCDNNEGA